MNNGYFNKIFHIDHEYYPTNMNLKNLRNIYELYEGRKYHPIRYNCKNWAKDVFNRIKNDF
jgi:beta-galactosidase GanA